MPDVCKPSSGLSQLDLIMADAQVRVFELICRVLLLISSNLYSVNDVRCLRFLQDLRLSLDSQLFAKDFRIFPLDPEWVCDAMCLST